MSEYNINDFAEKELIFVIDLSVVTAFRKLCASASLKFLWLRARREVDDNDKSETFSSNQLKRHRNSFTMN